MVVGCGGKRLRNYNCNHPHRSLESGDIGGGTDFIKGLRIQYFQQITEGNNSYDYTQKFIIITHKRTKTLLYENTSAAHKAYNIEN